MRIRTSRQPPQPFLLRVQLADALIERSARETPQRTDDDLEQGQELLLTAASAHEVSPADVPALAMVVHERVDTVGPRPVRASLLNRTVAQLEQAATRLAELAWPTTASREPLDSLAERLGNDLFFTSLKRMLLTGADVHLQHTVSLAQRLATSPATDPVARQHRLNAAMALLARADATIDGRADLDAAEGLLRSILDSNPDLPDRAMVTVNLGFALIQRYRLLHEEAALTEGRGLLEAAIRQDTYNTDLIQAATVAYMAVPSQGGQERARDLLAELPPSAAFDTQLLHFVTSLHGVDPDFAWEAASALQDLLDDSPQIPFGITSFVRRELGRQMLRAGEWERALVSFAAARDEFADLYEVQALPASRERILGLRHDLAVLHAYALTRVGDLAAAIDMLEESRARLLTEALELDAASLDQLPAAVADRYRAAARRVHELSLTWQTDTARTGLSGSEEFDRAREELRSAVDAVREEPGGAGFLVPSGAAEARRAASAGRPIVYLAAAEPGGFALIVDAGPEFAPRLVDLPELNRPEVADRAADLLASHHTEAKSWPGELESMLGWLGAVAMEPLLEALDDAEEAVLIPMDLLGLLPLHAAILSDGSSVLDRLAFSQAPNARAYITARDAAEAAVRPEHLLIVSDTQPDTDPAALEVSRQEAAAVTAHFTDVIPYAGTEARREAVLAALSGRDVLHFACHGAADLASPRQSGVRLADASLTVADLLSAPLACRLAVLSACETAMIGIDVPDEVVGLPAGLVQAGCAGVVGTLWRIDSQAAALLICRFYDAWRVEGQPPLQAVCTAQRWLRQCTNEEAHRRYPSVRPEPARSAAALAVWRRARQFAHPRYWAALNYVGA